MPASTPGLARKPPIAAPIAADRGEAGARGEGSHAVGDRIAQDGDQRRQERHEDRAEHRAMQRAQPAHDHQQQELDRQQDVEDVRRQEGDLVREQRAGEAHYAGRIGKGHRLVDREVDAHRLRRDLAVANRDPGPAGGRAQQVARQPQGQHEKQQAEEIERSVGGELDAEDHRLVDLHAGEAMRHRFPAAEHLLDDHREGQRGDRQIDAGHAQRRQSHDQARGRGEHHGEGHRHHPRHAVLDEVGVSVGTDAEEGRVAERHQAGVADQHHQRDAADAVDEDPGGLADVVVVHQQRQDEHQDGEQAVPEGIDLVAEDADVLVVGGLELEAHGPPTPSCA